MGNFNAPVLTNEGAAYLASVIAAQGTVNFTKMKFSTTNYAGSESTLTAATFLGVFKTATPSASVVDGTTINVTASFDNSGFTMDYSLYSVGIIVDDNGTDVLLAVCTTSVPDPISRYVSPGSMYAYSVNLGVSTTENISVTASTAGMLTVGDIVDDLTSSAANKPLSANQGKALKALLQAHEDKLVYSANGVHGIKYQNGNLSVYDSVNEQWVVINTGTSFALGPCVSITVATGDEELTLQWTDPSDVVIGGTTVAAWAGTKVVRKIGSAPTNENDGTVVVNETTRNQYSSSGFVDTGLTNGTTYYYGFFPYTTANVYNYTATDSGTPVQSTVTVTLSIESAASDTVYITGPGLDGTDFITTDSSGSGSGTLDIVPGETYTFTSSVAKALDGSDNYYSKNVILTNSLSQTISIMPDITYYWYGNEKATFNALSNNAVNYYDFSIDNSYPPQKIKQSNSLYTAAWIGSQSSSGTAFFEFTADLTEVSAIHVVSERETATTNPYSGVIVTKSGTLNNTMTNIVTTNHNVAKIAQSDVDVTELTGTRYIDVGIELLAQTNINAYCKNTIKAVYGT